MSATLSFREAEKKIESLNYPLLVKHYAKEQHLPLTKLSVLMGKESSFLIKTVQRKNLSVPAMYALSQYLSTNLFEPFCNLLPENIRPTRQEKALQQQLADLQKQYDDLKKERDLLKEIVMK